ncbi:hypothetical protein BESB_072520 [Besnoitia besnoiti]|uniref:HEAT repeat-containing protein 1 n=1 Tax=Besnoitia besnoiti TaxID=94643 RepID=A0A2A9MFE6_BESBE|nr:uncharacterized protein BESB_072520 [Besnoitia besnoiti]PFH34100.1 hypothetical protein BESB_072520 [Besnoitia besnoiti]
MVSELQRQLALHRQTRGVGSSSGSCSSARRIHSAPSLLFDPRKAASVELSTLRDVALTSLQSLIRRDPLVEVLEPLFTSTAGKQEAPSGAAVSRDFLTAEQARRVDRRVALCCDLLGPFFLLQDAQYLLEYLLRQYAVHKHNQDALLALALPYHSSPVFIRLARLLSIPPQSPWTFLERMRTSGALLQRKDLVKIVLSSPFLLQFVVSTVSRVSSPLSAARLKEAGLSLPSHLRRNSAHANAGADEASFSLLPAQNTPLLSFFTLLVSEALVTAPSLAAVRSLTPCLLPFLLSTLRPAAAVRTPELHAASMTVFTQLASRAPLEPRIVSAALQQLAQTLVFSSKDDSLQRLPAAKENELFSLLVVLAESQSLALQGTLPEAVTRRLSKWPRLADALQEVLFVQRLDCAPFLRAFFKSLLSFFVSSAGDESFCAFSALQERLLAAAKAVCAACVASGARQAPLLSHSSLSPSSGASRRSQEVSSSLIVIALTLFDSFARTSQQAQRAAAETSASASAFARVRREHPLLFAALCRLLLEVDAVSPLSIPKALAFFSRATEAERKGKRGGVSSGGCADLVLLLSHVFDSVPSPAGPVYAIPGAGAEETRKTLSRMRGEGLSLCSALMADEAELRREGVRGALACVRRQEAESGDRRGRECHTRSDEEAGETDEAGSQARAADRGALLGELLLDRLEDEDSTLVVEVAEGMATLCSVLPPFICLHRATSLVLANLDALLPSPLAAVSLHPAAAQATQVFLSAVLAMPRLREVMPALLRACAASLRHSAATEKEDGAEAEAARRRERFAEEVVVRRLLPVALALAWGARAQEADAETAETDDNEANEAADNGEVSAPQARRKALCELQEAAIDVLNAVGRRSPLEGGSLESEGSKQFETLTRCMTLSRLASSASLRSLAQLALCPLPLPPPPVSASAATPGGVLSAAAVESFLEREARAVKERRHGPRLANVTGLYTAAGLLEIAGAALMPSSTASPASSLPAWTAHAMHLCEELQRRLSACADDATEGALASKGGSERPKASAAAFPRAARAAVKTVAAGVASLLLARGPNREGDGSGGVGRGALKPAVLSSFFTGEGHDEAGRGEGEEGDACEGRLQRSLRRRLLLLAFSDVALFAPVVQAFLESFRGRSLLFVALLSQLLAQVSLPTRQRKAYATRGITQAGAEAGLQRTEEEQILVEGDDEQRIDETEAPSADEDGDCAALWLSFSFLSGSAYSGEDAPRLSATLRQQIEVNLLDMSRALLAQAARRQVSKKSLKAAGSESAASGKKPDGERGAEDRTAAACVGILTLPLWLAVHHKAQRREVREAVVLLLKELAALLKLDKDWQSSDPRAGVTAACLQAWWTRLAPLGLLRGRPADLKAGKGEKIHDELTQNADKFVQAALTSASTSCVEFLSQFLSRAASSALAPAAFGAAVAASSDAVASFFSFALAFLLPEGSAQEYFSSLLLEAPAGLLLTALLPALGREVEMFVVRVSAHAKPQEEAQGQGKRRSSAHSSPLASPSSFSRPSPSAASLSPVCEASVSASHGFGGVSPLIVFALQLLTQLGANQASSPLYALLSAVDSDGRRRSLWSLAPDCSESLVCSVLLPFIRLLCSPAVAAPLRAFYQRPAEEAPSARVSERATLSLPLSWLAEVADAAGELVDGVMASGILQVISDELRLELLLALLRLSSASPQLATRLRLQASKMDAREPEAKASDASVGAPRPQSETMLPVRTLLSLVEAVGVTEQDESAGAQGAQDGRRQGAAVSQKRGQADEATRPVTSRDAVIADFVDAQLQGYSAFVQETARLSGRHAQRDKKVRRAAGDDRNQRLEEADILLLGPCALGKLQAVLQIHLACETRRPAGAAGDTDEAMRRTLESLLSVFVTATSTTGALRILRAKQEKAKKSKALKHPGDDDEVASISARSRAAAKLSPMSSLWSFHEASFRGLAATCGLLAQSLAPKRSFEHLLVADGATRNGRLSEASRRLDVGDESSPSSLLSPVLLASVLQGSSAAADTLSSLLSQKGEPAPGDRLSTLHTTLRDLLKALGELLALAGVRTPRVLSTPHFLSALRGALPSLFAMLDVLRAHSALDASCDSAAGRHEGYKVESGATVRREVLRFVRTVMEPLCIDVFVDDVRGKDSEGATGAGRSPVRESRAAVAELAVALGAALGNDALVGGCLTILVHWEAAFLKRRGKAAQEHAGSGSEEASNSEEASDDEESDAEAAQSAEEAEEEGDDEVLLLDKKERKEREKRMRAGWKTRRALLERLKEILKAHADAQAASFYGHRLLTLAQLGTGALVLQCEARERLLSCGDEVFSRQREDDAATSAGRVVPLSLPSCVQGNVATLRQSLLQGQGLEAAPSAGSGDSCFAARGQDAARLAEVYCRAASTATLLLYEQLKSDGLPDLQRVGALAARGFALDSTGEEEEMQAILELIQALLSIKIVSERRRLAGSSSDGLHAGGKKRRGTDGSADRAYNSEVQRRVFNEETLLKQRAELLLESVIRALSPLVGCMRVALGCMGVRHTFFLSGDSVDELRSRFEAARGQAKTAKGASTAAPFGASFAQDVSDSEPDEDQEADAEQIQSIHLLVSDPAEPLGSSPARLSGAACLLATGKAACAAAAEAVAEGDRFVKSALAAKTTTNSDYVFFALLFRSLASQLETHLGAAAGADDRRQGEKKPKKGGDKCRGAEDRAWKTLFSSSSWTEASLTPPYALLLAVLAKRLLRPCAVSSSSAASSPASASIMNAGIAAWQFATNLARLAGGHLPEAFRDGCIPSVLGTWKRAAHAIPALSSLSAAPSASASTASQANLRSIISLSTAASRCLLALSLTSHGREGEKHVGGVGTHAARSLHAAALFLPDFNALFARISLLLRALMPPMLTAEDGVEPRLQLQDVFHRLLLIRDPRVGELAVCLVAALLGLLQRVGAEFFLPHVGSLVETTLLNPLLLSSLSHQQALPHAGREDAGAQARLRARLVAPQKLPLALLSQLGLSCLDSSDDGDAADEARVVVEFVRKRMEPMTSLDASLQLYMVDASVELPRVRRQASRVLEQIARRSAFALSSSLFGRKRDVAAAAWFLGAGGDRKASSRGDLTASEGDLWREQHPVVSILFAALQAEIGTSMRIQGAISLLLPSLHNLFFKKQKALAAGSENAERQHKGVDKKRKKAVDAEATGAKGGGSGAPQVSLFSTRGLEDLQASRTVELLGTIIGSQSQARADAKRPVLTKLMLHLVHLCLSRAEASGEAAPERLRASECFAEQIYGGQVQNVHRQLLWGSTGGDREAVLEDTHDEEEDEEDAPEQSQPCPSSAKAAGMKPTKRPRGESEAAASADSAGGPPEEENGNAIASPISLLQEFERSVRLLPPAAFAPACLHRMESALYCAFRSWSQKLNMQQLQSFLLALLRSLRGPKRALMQPSTEAAEGDSDASEETESSDEDSSAAAKRRQQKAAAAKKQASSGGVAKAHASSETLASSASIREICGTRLLVLFYTAAIRDFGSVGGVEALLEDLLADFQSALAACRDQALELVESTDKSGEKKKRDARPRVLESDATWFWFELGMPILLALSASLRSWNKELSGALPPSLFERLLTCALDAVDVLGVLPRLSLPGYAGRDRDSASGDVELLSDVELRKLNSERKRKRAQAQRLSKLWFCTLRSFVTGLFEHTFGDKTRVEELNLSLLEKVQSCGKGNIRFAAARMYLHLWKRLGLAMVDTLGDSLQTLVELLESADEEIEMATRELVRTIEGLTGESLAEKLKA